MAVGCPHGGLVAQVSAGGAAVRIDGAPVATAADLFTVSGCAHVVAGRPQPCTSVRWAPDGGGRDVCVDGVPVLLDSTAAMCFSAGLVPQGPPVVVAVHQVSGARQGVFSR
ncbi:hypothetical protein MOV08_17335 [Streptomyces yunnanensis]|uniref:Uncharacterized protein n=1 Tax=Streptomyces yunnanensis TaxID=156453 RepID=A0ABY8A7C5_9ACTN|nr:hypothetical protein [Streptomyces yunnanensis]WEB40869.1 hypothetical protein MOV08_17335 [Streptomyces yunnanensis]